MAAGSGWAGREALGTVPGPLHAAWAEREGRGKEGVCSIPRKGVVVIEACIISFPFYTQKTQKHIEMVKVGPAQIWI